ncbi:hypothetical protein CfE428DRAFT_2382 [Chthoniobacter flavus Ellin428]|uniref:Uncharacterized protein n=1 Tax=Chthoniobacter flavus Ellin428 TaxID=497964 RepID=B4D1A1_9BACT|nr:hypothetical protein [Chthoniobacter flavus]EDY19793.1 hypothetical protein CfE428DRAFT_2382 [Chthoniobacter flavus Ellin428]TCO91933.1 hypothetical protein EV701_107214 [Chthoniobacter flavus]
MKYSLQEWLFTLLPRCVLLIFALIPIHLHAQLVPSEPKTFEWMEPHPQFKIAHSDNYVEYKRHGKVVYRTIERTTNVSMPSHPGKASAPVVTHHIEFIVNGEVIASVDLEKGDAMSWTLNSGAGLQFDSGYATPDKGTRFFQVCVPKFDYFEYVEISGSEAKSKPQSDSDYIKQKEAFIKMTDVGAIKPPYFVRPY